MGLAGEMGEGGGELLTRGLVLRTSNEVLVPAGRGADGFVGGGEGYDGEEREY